MPSPTAPAYHYHVTMTCGGCSGAINRVLTKQIQPPNAFTVSLPQQQVLVWGPELPSFDDVTEKIAKTGKKITDKKVIENEADIPAITA